MREVVNASVKSPVSTVHQSHGHLQQEMQESTRNRKNRKLVKLKGLDLL